VFGYIFATWEGLCRFLSSNLSIILECTKLMKLQNCCFSNLITFFSGMETFGWNGTNMYANKTSTLFEEKCISHLNCISYHLTRMSKYLFLHDLRHLTVICINSNDLTLLFIMPIIKKEMQSEWLDFIVYYANYQKSLSKWS
jgi:hypothetical protein